MIIDFLLRVQKYNKFNCIPLVEQLVSTKSMHKIAKNRSKQFIGGPNWFLKFHGQPNDRSEQNRSADETGDPARIVRMMENSI